MLQEKDTGFRWLGQMERIAIARLAYNATVQYAKLGGRSMKAWDELYDRAPDGWSVDGIDSMPSKANAARIVSRIEGDLRDAGLAPADPTLFEAGCDQRFFCGVAEAAVKVESNWKRLPGRGRAPTRADVVAGLEDLGTAALTDFATPREIAVSPEAWALLNTSVGKQRDIDPEGSMATEPGEMLLSYITEGGIKMRLSRILGGCSMTMRVTDALLNAEVMAAMDLVSSMSKLLDAPAAVPVKADVPPKERRGRRIYSWSW